MVDKQDIYAKELIIFTWYKAGEVMIVYDIPLAEF